MTVTAYLLYLAIATAMTIWVAFTLSTNGKIYLIRCFGHDAELATSINHLLVVGFYLLNLGFIALTLSLAGDVANTAQMLRFLGGYVGMALLMLGAMHFLTMGLVTNHGRKVADWVRSQHKPAETAAAPLPTGEKRSIATAKREKILS